MICPISSTAFLGRRDEVGQRSLDAFGVRNPEAADNRTDGEHDGQTGRNSADYLHIMSSDGVNADAYLTEIYDISGD
jgi:hypothetical protein